jgi:hypothetical protein
LPEERTLRLETGLPESWRLHLVDGLDLAATIIAAVRTHLM